RGMSFLRFPHLFFILCALVLLGGATILPTYAAGIVVDDAGDTLHGSGCASDGTTSPCTLRDAITFAITNAGADVVTFNIPDDPGPACSANNVCTITLGSTLPAINDALTIDGAPNSGKIT